MHLIKVEALLMPPAGMKIMTETFEATLKLEPARWI